MNTPDVRFPRCSRSSRARRRCLIGGQWREAASGETDRIDRSGDRKSHRQVSRRRRRGCGSRGERRAARVHRAVAEDLALRARTDAAEGGGADRESTARNSRNSSRSKTASRCGRRSKEVGTAVSWTEYYAGWTTKLTRRDDSAFRCRDSF